MTSFLQVLRFSPSNAEAMEELVKLYVKLGDEEKAAKYRTKLEIVSENIRKDREATVLSQKEEALLN